MGGGGRERGVERKGVCERKGRERVERERGGGVRESE